jgi:lysophospholipase L1-like esterase
MCLYVGDDVVVQFRLNGTLLVVLSRMKAIPTLSGSLVVLLIAEMARLRWHYVVGRNLAEQARRYERRGGQDQRRVLIIGDSSAVGTGANAPEDSVAGRLAAAYPHLDVWNLAENGLRTAGLLPDLLALNGTRFDLVLIHVGVNDIVRFTPLPQLREQLMEALTLARRLSDHVLLLTGGNLGLSPALTPGFRWVITRRTREVRLLFLDVAAVTGVLYVDMFDGVADRPFVANPRRFFARDGFHPNSEGYALWYEAVTATLRNAGVRLA